MAINLPNRRELPGFQSRQLPDQTDQIISVLGNNPYATGITAASTALSDVIKKRAELRKQAMQTKAVEKGLGMNEGSLDESLTPELGLKIYEAQTAREKATKDQKDTAAAIANIRAVEKARGLAPGSLGDDPTTARTLLAQIGSDKRHDDSLDALNDQRKITNDLRVETFKKSVVDKFTSDPSVKKSQQSIDAAGQIRDLALSGNPIAAAAIPTYSARMSGEVGNLSEADKRPFGGSQAILSRVEAALTQMATGELTQDNAKFIIDLTNLVEKKANDNITSLAKTRSKQYSKQSHILKEDELFDALNPGGANAANTQNLRDKYGY